MQIALIVPVGTTFHVELIVGAIKVNLRISRIPYDTRYEKQGRVGYDTADERDDYHRLVFVALVSKRGEEERPQERRDPREYVQIGRLDCREPDLFHVSAQEWQKTSQGYKLCCFRLRCCNLVGKERLMTRREGRKIRLR